ncbi:hypothetical protein [Actinomadura vinacea]
MDGFAVDEHFGSSQELLGELCTVWYATRAGDQAEWNDPGAVFKRVREAACEPVTWDPERRRKLDALVRGFRDQREPVQLVLPVLRVVPGREVVLDGTHRAVAAYRAGVPVTLFVFALHGPLRPAMLPDIVHHL